MSDLISRQEVIRRICNNDCGGSSYCGIPCDEVRIVNEVPAVNQWTRCSKKLPDEWEVLCCNKHGDYLLGHPYEDESSETGFSAESNEALLMDCTAWMPLPEVWKGEKENEPGE